MIVFDLQVNRVCRINQDDLCNICRYACRFIWPTLQAVVLVHSLDILPGPLGGLQYDSLTCHWDKFRLAPLLSNIPKRSITRAVVPLIPPWVNRTATVKHTKTKYMYMLCHFHYKLHCCQRFGMSKPNCSFNTWRRHQMATFYRVTGPLCGDFTGPGEFPTQRPVTRIFDVFIDLRLNKRLSEQPWGWWFETPSWSLWRHCNDRNCISRLLSYIMSYKV